MDTILVFRMSRYDSWQKKVQTLTTAAERRGWRIQVIDQPADGDAMRKLVSFWRPRGVIIAEVWKRKMSLPIQKIPAVFFDCNPTLVPKGCHLVLHAAKPLCDAVVRELLSIGCTSVAYIGWFRNVYWSDVRIRCLKETLSLHGMSLHTFDMDPATGKDPAMLNKRLCKWLKSLPRNCGIFAANDTIAEPLIAAANACSLDIPNDIAIISVGDEPALCERLSPSLTAFKLEYGILAEQIMEMLGGEQSDAKHDAFTFTLVRRQSTRRFKRRDADVENAVERIRKEACGGLKPRDILSSFSCSCRMAEIRFKAVTGSTIEQAILDARLERCRELLSDGKIPIGNIADRCGFPSPLVMRRQFRAQMKMTPREWRQANFGQSRIQARMDRYGIPHGHA